MEIGFSTGALGGSDVLRGFELARDAGVSAVELSALRGPELDPLLAWLGQESTARALAPFAHVSVHAPGRFEPGQEARVARALEETLVPRQIPFVLHPNAVGEPSLWRPLGPLVRIENMDGRKPTGRTADELRGFFRELPEARLCLDLAHAWQIDPTGDEARRIVDAFGDRLAEIHLSGITTEARHRRLGHANGTLIRFAGSLRPRLPEGIPVILESPIEPDEIAEELAAARQAVDL